MRYTAAAILLVALNTPLFAQTTLPYTFAPGTVAKASEVNANFQALLAAVNKLEGAITAADVAGTYALASFGVNMTGVPPPGATGGSSARIEHTSTNGVATFNANGTFSVSPETTTGGAVVFSFLNQAGTVVTATAASQNAAPPPTVGGTWTLSGKTLTLAVTGGGGGTFTAAVGSRVFIGVNGDSASQDLHFLIRTN